ncbi:MAG: hypothetical protein SFW62_04935 [Alphaproteobacteria bacterium]|nr:hypothetical protein [Alphaproteobacteria bacterium]
MSEKPIFVTFHVVKWDRSAGHATYTVRPYTTQADEIRSIVPSSFMRGTPPCSHDVEDGKEPPIQSELRTKGDGEFQMLIPHRAALDILASAGIQTVKMPDLSSEQGIREFVAEADAAFRGLGIDLGLKPNQPTNG